MQIRTRLTVQFSLLVSGILLVTFVAIYFFSYINLREDFYDRLVSKANSSARLLGGVVVSPDIIRALEGSNTDRIYNQIILIYDDKNRLMYTNSSTSSKSIHVSRYWLNEVRKAGEIRYTDGQSKVVALSTKLPYTQAVVLLGAQDVVGQVNLINLSKLLIGLFIGVTIIVAFAGWIFAKRALRPISRVMNEIEGILPQKLDTRLEVPNQQDEIGRLTTTFNKLLDRIETAFQMQKIFVANVSHELKNPLTKIRSQLEVSAMKERSTSEYRSTIHSVLEDIQELAQLSNTLLELAKVSEDQGDLLTEVVRIDELLWDTRTTLSQSSTQCFIQFQLDELPDDDTWLEISGNSTLLKTAFLNLMDNACKFSDDHSVNVSLRTSEHKVTVQFSDKGKGIPEPDRTLVFQPFYRSENTANIKGYGIGLSLVDRIVKLHNGTTTILPNHPQGTIFILEFLRL